MKKILETERLYLREFTLEDASILLELNQDPDVMRYTGDPHPWSSLEESEKIFTDVILPQYKNKIGRWAVFLKDTGEFIGWCGLKDIGEEIDLGYRYHKKYWGNGYATEAANAVLYYGIERQLENIVGRASVENKGSVKVLEKIGLTFKEFYSENGEESVKYVLTYD
jgi:ribosomal-protein-alanine N-acetyltransferase